MSKWGRLAAAGALGVDACCVALYCAHPRFYGDAPLGSKRWRARLDPRRSLFDAVVGLAFLRVAFYAVCDDAPGLLARFERRGASIRAFWAGVVEELDAELARARALVLDSLPRGLSSRDRVADAEARDEPFALLLRLFAHEDVLAALRGAFRADREATGFYVLQLATFVLRGLVGEEPGPAADGRGSRAVAALRVARAALRAAADRVAKFDGVPYDEAKAYDDAPAFVDALTAISDGLCDLPREARAAALAAALEELDATAVPSLRGAYVPLGRAAGRHRVLRVHAAESRCFSTKERCPFLCAVEAAANPILPDFFGRGSPRVARAAARALAAAARPPLGAATALSLARGEPPEDATYGATDRSVLAPRLPPPARRRRPRSRSGALGRRRGACSRGRGRRRLVPVIVKARDDLRQEQFAAQLLRMASRILEDARVPVVLRTYDVVATGPDAGLIEALPDAMSLDALRRSDGGSANLLDFFYRRFGAGPELARARANFVESLAPACVLSYLLQIKDRHNGNILLDAAGRLAHVDFGYLLASSPGGNLGFEAAPFKLTAEFLDVVGPDYRRFRDLCVRVFLALRAERHKLLLLAEMTVSGCDHLPCFDGRPRETIDALRRRFKPKLSDRQVRAFVHGLIDKSTNNWRTHTPTTGTSASASGSSKGRATAR
ncbi:phosphatidylinositol kinase [Aureococcus anophagefferens]|nr:phosphatidylinositol kinase [Aureococcus anophagefferens]